MKEPTRAQMMAEEALRALGKEDLLFSHHGGVHARPKAYDRLAEFFEKFALEEKAKLIKQVEDLKEEIRMWRSETLR